MTCVTDVGYFLPMLSIQYVLQEGVLRIKDRDDGNLPRN